MAWPMILSRMQESPVLTALGDASALKYTLCGIFSLIGYVLLASSMRFQRRRVLHEQYPYKTRESMAKMTDHDAWAIQKTILQMEFPFIVLKSLQFALFRVSNTVPFELVYD